MKKAIGVLGGMGPQASAYLYELLIEKSVECFSAQNNEDFPEIILHSIPIPDFISSNEKRDEAFEMLKDRVILMNKLDILCLSIACNTVHVLIDRLQQVSKVKFVSMIDEVVKRVYKDGRKKIGLMGPPCTVRSNMYQSKLRGHNMSVLTPSNKQTEVLEEVIRNVIKGKMTKTDIKSLLGVADSLKKRGADGIILGCTELPLVFPRKYSLPVYNSVEILGMALLRKYYK